MDTSGLVTLRYVVSSALNRIGLDVKFTEKLMQIAIEGFTEMNMFITKTFKVSTIDVNPNTNLAQLPSDYIDFLRIAITINGKLYTLTRNEQLILPRTDDCGSETNLNPRVQNTDLYNSQEDIVDVEADVLLSLIAHHYGTSGGANCAYYRIDEERRLIVFQGRVPNNQFILEYISSGVSVDTETLIPRECVPALRDYVIWQSIENDTRVPMNEKERKKAQYEKSIDYLVAFQNSFSVETYRDIIYETSRQTPKR